MSARLHLKKLRLSCAKENLRLFITPILELSSTDSTLDSLQPSEIFRALGSGSIWLSRGADCQIKIRISFNGASLQSLNHEDVIEDLGTSIREAALWNQLSLKPSLEIPSHQSAHIDSGDICIHISHAQPPQNVLEGTTSLSIILGDTKPPDGVPCIGLKSIDLTMDFHSIRKSPAKSRKRKRRADESMLLDYPEFTEGHRSLQTRNLQTESAPAFSPSFSQLYGAYVMEEAIKKQEMPIKIDKENDGDLLLLETNHTQLLTPPSSAPQSSSPVISKRPVQLSKVSDFIEGALQVKLDLPVATKLADVGIRTLIGGRQIKATPGVTLLKPDQEYTLSDLAPSLWSPGYLKAVSQRSRFLPILSRVLSTSLLKHVQSSSLRTKLFDLADSQTSPLLASSSEVAGASDGRPKSINHKIARIVQVRVWKMTQKSLNDQQAARRLHSISLLPDGPRSKRVRDDLLAGEIESESFSSLADDLAEFMESEFEDFFEEEIDVGDNFIWNDLLQDTAESCDQMDKHDAEEALREADESLHIPDEFWEDLRSEEGDPYQNEAFCIPDEFWDDLLMEEREGIALGGDCSSMLM